MASITKRGKNQYQALIRRKGYPVQIRTFASEMKSDRLHRKTLPTMPLTVTHDYSGRFTGQGTSGIIDIDIDIDSCVGECARGKQQSTQRMTRIQAALSRQSAI